MEFLLFLIIIVVLCNSSDRNTARTGEQMAAGVATAFGLMFIGVILLLGFAFFPTFTKWTLIAGAVAAVALLIRWIYRRFFSPEARLRAAYNRMHKRYNKLSWSVRVDLRKSTPENRSWQLAESERILKLCREEHERYSKLPPETGGNAYLTDFYVRDIQKLEDEMRSFATPQ